MAEVFEQEGEMKPVDSVENEQKNLWKQLERIEVNKEKGYEVIGPYHDWLRLRGVDDPLNPGNEKVVLFNKNHFRFWGGTEIAQRDSQAPEIAGYKYRPEREYRVLWQGGYDSMRGDKNVFVRLQSLCLNGIVEGAATCDCLDQFELCKKLIAENWEQRQEQGMIILALHHVGKGLGPRNHALIDSMSEVVAIKRGQEPDPSKIDRWSEPFVALSGKPECDELEDMIEILIHFGITNLKLIASTNNPRKIKRFGQEDFNLERVPITVPTNQYNEFELNLKKKAGHLLDFKNENEVVVDKAVVAHR